MEPRQVGAAYDIAAAYFKSELAPDSTSRAALEAWRGFLPATARVIDVGCGAGRATRWLEARGVAVFSVDLSPKMLQRTRAGRPEAWTALADMRALPVPTAAFRRCISVDISKRNWLCCWRETDFASSAVTPGRQRFMARWKLTCSCMAC